MPNDITMVLDANVYIRACVAASAGFDFSAGGWKRVGPQANPLAVAAALIAGLMSDCAVDVVVGGDADLDDLVLRKLTQPRDEARPEDRGLGWTRTDADATYLAMRDGLGDVGRLHWFDPPARVEHLEGADWEDSRIFGLFRTTSGFYPTHDPFLITADKAFQVLATEACPTLQSGRRMWHVGSPARGIWLLRHVSTDPLSDGTG